MHLEEFKHDPFLGHHFWKAALPRSSRQGRPAAGCTLCSEVVDLGCHWTNPVWLVQTQGREISTTLTHDH